MPSSFKSMSNVFDIPICNSTKDDYCILEIIVDYDIFKISDLDICPKSCWRLQYKAKLDFWGWKQIQYKENHTCSIDISYAPPVLEVYEEYFIYDFIGMIGSVGGTLGMFIASHFIMLFFLYLTFFTPLKLIFYKKGDRKSQLHEICRKLPHVKT